MALGWMLVLKFLLQTGVRVWLHVSGDSGSSKAQSQRRVTFVLTCRLWRESLRKLKNLGVDSQVLIKYLLWARHRAKAHLIESFDSQKLWHFRIFWGT